MSVRATRSRRKWQDKENVSEASVQSDSRREAGFETPASDSDSGSSLFLTQSVSPASRTVKRLRPSDAQAFPSSQESEDEQERDGVPNAQHEDTLQGTDSDSETDYDDLLRRWKARVKTHDRPKTRRRPKRRREALKWMVFPFLKGRLSAQQKYTIVNSEIGGFFKCMSKFSKGGEERRQELDTYLLPSEWELNRMEESEEDDEDIKIVDMSCLIRNTSKRNRQTWLPCLKWKTRECTKQSNKQNQTRTVAENLMEHQDDTDVHDEIRSFDTEESHSRKKRKKSRKSPTRSSVSTRSSSACLSPDKSPFVQSLFMDHQEEHSENRSEVLVKCSQSQSLDCHQAQNMDQACKNWMEPIDETAVEDMQWSGSDQDEDKTQILEDNPMDRDDGEDALCMDNISFREHQVQDKDIHEGVPPVLTESEDLGNVGQGFISSQDLFEEPNNQASHLQEINFENENKEVLESHVGVHDDDGLILADEESQRTKSQRTPPVSPTVGDIQPQRKDKGKKALDDSVEQSHPSLPLDEYILGSRKNVYSTPSKDILTVRKEEKTETPLFVHSGQTFLKRRKGKKIDAHMISDNLSPIQADPDQNEDSAPHCNDLVKQKERKKVKNDGLFEEPVDTLPEISVPADSSLSVHDFSMECVSVDASTPKKKRKKRKHGEPVLHEDQWMGVEEPGQIPCQGSASLVSIAEETEHLTRTDLSSPSRNPEVNPLDSSTQVNKDLVQSGGLYPQRKKKKEAKKRGSSPNMSDQTVASQCREESHSSHGTKAVKKKKQRFIDDVGQEQAGDMAMANKNLGEPLDQILEKPAGIEIQPTNIADLKTGDLVTPSKKKKRKKQEMVSEETVDIEASLVKTTEQVEPPDAFQDSEQPAAELVLVRKVKKKKKKKDRTEICQEEEASENVSVSLGLGLGETTTSDAPSARHEAGGIGEEEGLGGPEPVKKKKKKKKRKELENDGWLSASRDLASLDGSDLRDTDQATVVKKASSGDQKLGEENPAPWCEMQLTNDTSKKKKHKRTKHEGSESSQEVLQSEDTVHPKEKKKKKKKRCAERDLEVYPEIVEHVCQESGSPSEPSEAIIVKKKKKKKKRKDTTDTGENECT